MRHVSVTLGLGSLLLLAGCNQFQPLKGGHAAQPVAARPTEAPTAAALVAYLNDNARRIQSLDCSELDLDARQRLQSVGLNGWMVCQKPRNFRMGARVVGNQAVDMGSNDSEFWYWISKAEPPYLFHCSYEDFSRGKVQMPFPFQPEWIMEAMGMAEYGAPESYRVNATQNSIELIQDTKTSQGVAVRKVTVFSRGPAQGTVPQVTAHVLQDANGKEICSAQVSEVQQDRASGAIIPKRVRLVWPQEHMELKMKLDRVSVNQPIPEQRVATLFTRPRLANVQSYDLARGLDQAPGQVRRTSGIQER
ncbi:MAG: hypothetical protein K2R98_16730 [Gemmataceae bacterium]|nr:hypothetical protein [Gemmataceae bacterium]